MVCFRIIECKFLFTLFISLQRNAFGAASFCTLSGREIGRGREALSIASMQDPRLVEGGA